MWPFKNKKKEFKTICILQAKINWTDLDLIETFSYILQENDYGDRNVEFDSYGHVKRYKYEIQHDLYQDFILPWLHHLKDLEPEKEKRKVVAETKDNVVYLKEEKDV